MSVADAFQRYNDIAQRLSVALAGVRRLPQFRQRPSGALVRRAESEVQNVEFGALTQIEEELLDALRNVQDPDVRIKIAEIGFLIGQLQELGLKFSDAEESYKRVLAAFVCPCRSRVRD
jgi:hypothetical protein